MWFKSTGVAAVAVALGVAGVVAGVAWAREDEHQHGAHAAAGSAAAETSAVGDAYTLDTCPVTGEKLGSMGEPVVYDYEGREIRFCCEGCVADFESDPEKYIAQIDEKLVADQLPHYPLNVCPVTGEPLDSMGGAVDYVYGNRLVRFCCAGCIAEFESNPAEYLAKLDSAVIAAQTPDYPLDHCLVLPDEEIGAEGTVDYVVANRLFRLCCTGCRDTIAADPATYLAQLDALRAD